MHTIAMLIHAIPQVSLSNKTVAECVWSPVKSVCLFGLKYLSETRNLEFVGSLHGRCYLGRIQDLTTRYRNGLSDASCASWKRI
jgi:hypothetical protein